jgi:chaperone modulatory protein CbpM
MITLDILFARFGRLSPDDLRCWIAEGYVRPDTEANMLVFQEIDVERVRLILELRDQFEVNDAALPVVLSLLDQLYAARRRLRELETGPDDRLVADG